MVNESVRQIVAHKANLMRNSQAYRQYLEELLKELNINDATEAALVGAADAMIYDIACSLDFTKQKGLVNDWSSYPIRRLALKQIWG